MLNVELKEDISMQITKTISSKDDQYNIKKRAV